MKCPSCGYVSFDKVEYCKQCGADLNLKEKEKNIFSFEADEEENGLSPQEPKELDNGIREEAWRLEKESSGEGHTAPIKEETPEAEQKIAKPQKEKPPAPEEKKPAETIKSDVQPENLEASSSDALLGGIFENWEETEPEEKQVTNSGSIRTGDAVEDVVFEDFSIDLEEPSTGEILEESVETEAESAKPEVVEEEMLPLENLDEVPSFFYGEEPASFIKRAVAFLIDNTLVFLLVALYVLAAGLGLALKGASLSWLTGNLWPVDAILPFFILSVIISGIYYVFTQWISGQTPGKRIFSLKVVSDKGESIPLTTSFFLWMAYIVSAVPLGLGFLWALFDKERRCWHDRLTRTMVVSDKNESA